MSLVSSGLGRQRKLTRDRKLFKSLKWERYPHFRKYLAVVHADLTETYARHVGKWLLIAPLIGIVSGLVIVLEALVILRGIWAFLLPRYCANHWLIIPGVLAGFGATGLMRRTNPSARCRYQDLRGWRAADLPRLQSLPNRTGEMPAIIRGPRSHRRARSDG